MNLVSSCLCMQNFTLDDELNDLLDKLKLYSYKKNFRRKKVTFSGLGKLTDKELKRLIKERIPRIRLMKYMEKHFFHVAGSKWEINRKKVEIDRTDLISSGSNGKIFRGTISVGISHLEVAIKEITLHGRVTKKKVTEEVGIMSNIRNNHVVKTFGCFFEEESNAAYIVLEYCSQGDLYHYQQERDAISKRLKLEFILQIARGMEYVHSLGIVHRDLKTKNILIGNDGKTLKICDFGASKLSENICSTFCGTPVFLAPELYQLGKKMIIPKRLIKPKLLDIYSFGVIIWSIWNNGLPPFRHLTKKIKNIFALLKQLREKKPPTDGENFKDMPKMLKELMVKCYQTDPKKRPQGFSEIVRDVENIITKESAE